MNKITFKEVKRMKYINNQELCNLLLYTDIEEKAIKYLLKSFDVINNDSIKRLVNTELNNNKTLFNRIDFLESLL